MRIYDRQTLCYKQKKKKRENKSKKVKWKKYQCRTNLYNENEWKAKGMKKVYFIATTFNFSIHFKIIKLLYTLFSLSLLNTFSIWL